MVYNTNKKQQIKQHGKEFGIEQYLLVPEELLDSLDHRCVVDAVFLVTQMQETGGVVVEQG